MVPSGKEQIRTILVTDGAVYNLNTGSFTCNRRVPLSKVEGATYSTTSDEIVIHVPTEYRVPISLSSPLLFFDVLSNTYHNARNAATTSTTRANARTSSQMP